MSKAAAGFLLAAVLGAGLAGGYFGRDLVAPPPRAAVRDMPAQDRIATLQAELAVLKAEKEYLTGRLKQVSEAGAEPAAHGTAGGAAPQPAAAVLTRRALLAPFVLASVDDADALFDDALARIDLETVLRLGAALLAMRQEGYEKFLALLGELTRAMEEDRHLRWFFQDERNAGLGMRWCAENADNVLRFGIYLRGRDPYGLPAEVSALRDRIDGDIGCMLLGFCGGGDAEIEQGLLSIYGAQVRAALPENGRLEGPEAEKAIDGLALLRSDAATEALLDLAEHVSPSVLGTIAAALIVQGTPRALAALRTLRAQASDPSLVEDIDRMLARRQGQAAR
ncbi:MAG TPA: hypothetical protein DCM87_06280 [Planctomycetes bacterium]|nr:hypothetical protein [Planctomycetota bacterium]